MGITKGQSINRTIERSLQNAVKISGEDHNFEDISIYIKDVGGEVEKYLKDAVYAGTRNRDNFVVLIDELLPLGMSQATLDELHEFRKDWYNKVKHDPAFVSATGDAIEALQEVLSTVRTVVAANLGSSNSPLIRPCRRIFHLAAWDHFIGGDTEVHIMPATAGDSSYVPSEIIYIEMSKWNEVIGELSKLGQLNIGPGSVPEQLYEGWRAEGDFLGGGAFEGDYRDLIGTLAKAERIEDILPSLKRENDAWSMVAAALSASVDAAAEGEMEESEAEAIDAVLRIGEDRYAAPRRSHALNELTALVVPVIFSVPQPLRTSLKGPMWLRSDRYDDEAKSSITSCKWPAFSVTQECNLIARLS